MVVLYIILGILALAAAYCLWVILSSVFINTRKEYDVNSRYYRCVLYSATFLAVFFGRIKIEIRGKEQVPAGRFLLVSNHRSKFDPILTWHILRRQDVAFISKKENFSVPFFGRIIRKCCFMAIDRENPRAALKTVERAAKLIQNDEVSVGVYPEGTRNYGEGLLPFHNGIFKIAQKAKVPIVVLKLTNTAQIQHNFPLRRTHVVMDFKAVLSADEVRTMRTVEIGERVRALLLEE
ncbi:MAG: 1-acyl-sn-glycerol-3-phosphate acyltransferase [Clostridia bacterium]|nr:1-acyl-sn-glycerol-3-phosphate acyltransferase [Clostridia bacterium]